MTQLLYNYRSIPSILESYSKLSYESKLIATISVEDSDEHRLLAKVQANISSNSKLKHAANYGVYFVGVRGKDETTTDSTSWRNPHEVLEVRFILIFSSFGFFKNKLSQNISKKNVESNANAVFCF